VSLGFVARLATGLLPPSTFLARHGRRNSGSASAGLPFLPGNRGS
jgi:hypothetical protein